MHWHYPIFLHLLHPSMTQAMAFTCLSKPLPQPHHSLSDVTITSLCKIQYYCTPSDGTGTSNWSTSPKTIHHPHKPITFLPPSLAPSRNATLDALSTHHILTPYWKLYVQHNTLYLHDHSAQFHISVHIIAQLNFIYTMCPLPQCNFIYCTILFIPIFLPPMQFLYNSLYPRLSSLSTIFIQHNSFTSVHHTVLSLPVLLPAQFSLSHNTLYPYLSTPSAISLVSIHISPPPMQFYLPNAFSPCPLTLAQFLYSTIVSIHISPSPAQFYLSHNTLHPYLSTLYSYLPIPWHNFI
jgi:hypothetical protein